MDPKIQKFKVDPEGKTLFVVKGDVDIKDVHSLQATLNDWLVSDDEPTMMLRVSNELEIQVERIANGKEEQT